MMSKLVILFAVFCAVFGAEKEDETKPSDVGDKAPTVPSPAITPYSAFPYGVQGFAGQVPYHQALAGFPYSQAPYYSGAAIGKSFYPYQPAPIVGSPLQKSAIGVPAQVGTPYSAALYGASSFGYPYVQQSAYTQPPYYSAAAIGKSVYPYQPAPIVGAPLQKAAFGVPPQVGTPYSAALYGASPYGYPDIQQSTYFPQTYQSWT